MPRTPGRPIDRSRLLAVVLVLASLGVVASNLAADDADAARPVYFSGTLEEGGVPVDGTRDVTLRLYDRGTGGTQVCVTSAAGTQVMRGQFRMALARSCVEAFRRRGGLWVEVQVGSTVFPERVPIGAVPYALDGAGDGASRPTPSPPATSNPRPPRPRTPRCVEEPDDEPPPPALTLRRGPASNEASCPRLAAYGGVERAYERDPAAPTGLIRCVFGSDTMVKVGAFWIDQYEAVLVPHVFWNNGRCDGGAAPYASGRAEDDYPEPAFPDDGNWTTPVRACSVAGLVPSRMMTWSQAQQACLLAGKRLCTVSEWHAAAAGTVHPGEHQGSQGGECHTQVVEPRPTGRAGARPADASSCISSWGAEDMVGNVWEWVDAAGGPAPSSGMQSVGSSVLPVVAAREGGTTWIGRLPVTLLRSGYWSYGANAGAVSPAGIASEPYADADIGVRCCVGGG